MAGIEGLMYGWNQHKIFELVEWCDRILELFLPSWEGRGDIREICHPFIKLKGYLCTLADWVEPNQDVVYLSLDAIQCTLDACGQYFSYQAVNVERSLGTQRQIAAFTQFARTRNVVELLSSLLAYHCAEIELYLQALQT